MFAKPDKNKDISLISVLIGGFQTAFKAPLLLISFKDEQSVILW